MRQLSHTWRQYKFLKEHIMWILHIHNTDVSNVHFYATYIQKYESKNSMYLDHLTYRRFKVKIRTYTKFKGMDWNKKYQNSTESLDIFRPIIHSNKCFSIFIVFSLFEFILILEYSPEIEDLYQIVSYKRSRK